MPGRCVLAVTVLAASVIAATPAAAFVPPGNRVVNAGAEEGLAGWQSTGTRVAGYADDAVPLPRASPFQSPDEDAGAHLFAADGGGAIWQVVDLADVAAAIDAGTQPIGFGAWLGGWGQAGNARLLVQPLDGAGVALGPPAGAGPPSVADRQSATGIVRCYGGVRAPVGTRSMLVRVEVGGSGLADIVYLTTALFGYAEVGGYEADGPGCIRSVSNPFPLAPAPRSEPPSASPAPARTPMFTVACSPKRLRFAVVSSIRSTVASFAVTARGRRISRGATRAIGIPAPRAHRTLAVRLTARMRTGDQTVERQRLRACA